MIKKYMLIDWRRRRRRRKMERGVVSPRRKKAGRKGEAGCAQEQGGVKGIQRGPTVVADDSAASTNPANTHQEPDSHMCLGLALSLCTTLPTLVPPPIHPHPLYPQEANLQSVSSATLEPS